MSKPVDAFTKSQMGKEPTGIIEGLSALCRAYSWYSCMHSRSDSKEWLVEYTAKHFPKKVNIVKTVEEKSLEVSMGWISRMLLKGVTLPADLKNRVESYINSLVAVKAMTKSAVKREATDKIGLYLPDFESAVDLLDKEFDTYSYLTSNSVPQSYAKRIAEYYTPLLSELQLAYDKEDLQVVEAYKHLRRGDLLITRRYIESILNDCNRYLGNVKKERAPKKKKAKSASQRLKHFKYMASHDQLKLTSHTPEAIFGASQLYVLNTTNNIMSVFIAKAGGLDVNRTAITNYDEDKSGAKRAGRKLKQSIDLVLNGNKKQRETVLDSLESAFVPFSDRINTNVVMLKVVK